MNNLTNLTKCLSDENRLKILRLLMEGEMCVCELVEALQAPQSRISQHLLRLRNEGLVQCSRQGQWMIYSVDKKALKKKLKMLKNFFFMDAGEGNLMAAELDRLARLQGHGGAAVKHEPLQELPAPA